ncbi:hypothetical protein BTO30_00580 [Domibacillus antri]|uniref:Uncharacterized protein n=1 Tax=Domibacillus antri TaxID=1714264 RepID=A0A1Q8Q9D1_9BACI|nr:hypothetical protein BTO30_00580 [Domibacillus antri]
MSLQKGKSERESGRKRKSEWVKSVTFGQSLFSLHPCIRGTSLGENRRKFETNFLYSTLWGKNVRASGARDGEEERGGEEGTGIFIDEQENA